MKKILSIMFLLTALIFVGCSEDTKDTTDETNVEGINEDETKENLETTETENESVIESEEETTMEEDNTASDDFRIDDDKDRTLIAELTQDDFNVHLEYKAKGDKVVNFKQFHNLDISSLNLKDLESQQAKNYIAEVENLSRSYSKHNETKYNGNVNTKEVKSELEIDLSKDGTYEKLVQDKLVVDQNTNLDYMSLTEEIKRLKAYGYEFRGAEDIIDKIKEGEKLTNPLLPTEKINERHLASAYRNDNNMDDILYYFGEEDVILEIVNIKSLSKELFTEEQLKSAEKDFDNISLPDNVKDYVSLEKDEDDEKLTFTYDYKIKSKEALNDLIEANIINLGEEIENPDTLSLEGTLENVKSKGFEVIKY